MARMIEEAAPVLAHVHLADTFNHKASSGLRYIINPPGAQVRVHQHLNIGEGEVDWDMLFGTLKKWIRRNFHELRVRLGGEGGRSPRNSCARRSNATSTNPGRHKTLASNGGRNRVS